MVSAACVCDRLAPVRPNSLPKLDLAGIGDNHLLATDRTSSNDPTGRIPVSADFKDG